MRPQIEAKVNALFNLYGNNLISINITLHPGMTPSEVVNAFVAQAELEVNQLGMAVNAAHKDYLVAAIATAGKVVNLSALAENLNKVAGHKGFVYGKNEIIEDCDSISSLISDATGKKCAFAITVAGANLEQLEYLEHLVPNPGIIFVESNEPIGPYLVFTPEEAQELRNKNKNKKEGLIVDSGQPRNAEKLIKILPAPAPVPEPEWLEVKDKVENNNNNQQVEDILNVFKEALEKAKGAKGGKVDQDIVKKIKVAVGMEEPEKKVEEEAQAPAAPKNPEVLAAYQKMLEKKQAKLDQKQKDLQIQNPARQKQIKSQLAAILLQRKEKEQERQRLIAAEAKKSLEEQKAKIGDLFAVPKDGEFNGFKFNPAIQDDGNDAETMQALENLKKIDAAKPKEKELSDAEKKIEEAKKLAEQLKIQQVKQQQEEVKRQQEAKQKELQEAAEVKAKKKKNLTKAASDAIELLNSLAGNNGPSKKKKISIDEGGPQFEIVKVDMK